MAISPIVGAVVIGGVAYSLTRKDMPVPLPGSPGYLGPNYGSTIGQIATGNDAGSGYSYDQYIDNYGQSQFGDTQLDPDIRPKLDLLSATAEAAYNKMDTAGRSAAANQLNQSLDIQPPLNGSDSWQTVARVAGGAGGAAVCNAIPGIGTAASPLCAIAGAYLGVKLEDWISQEMPALGSWVSANFSAAAGAIASTAQDVVKDVGGWLNDLF